MPELFDDGPGEEEFAIPGDDKRLEGTPWAANAESSEPPVEETPDPEPAPEPELPPAAEAAVEVTAEEPPAADDDAELQAYLNRYGDSDKALRAAVEREKLMGRQAQELGELRAMLEERMAEDASAVQPQYDQDAVEMWLADNPTRIPEVAQNAFYAGNEQVLDAAVAAWRDLDRASANKFERWMVGQQVRAELHAETQTRDQSQADWNAAAAEFSRTHDDLEQVAPKMLELAKSYPNMVQILRTGDPTAKTEVLDFLYTKARGHVADNLAAAARDVAREQAQEAEKAIKDAVVASAATAVPAGVTDIAAAIAADWDTLDRPFASGEDGWNIS